MQPVFIYDAVRTPRGKAKAEGGLAELTPQELVKQQCDALMQRYSNDSFDPDALLLGCVGQVGDQGGHIAKGHPLGASGAILISSLLDCLDAADGSLGLAVVSGASVAGGAMVLERLN